MSLGVKTAQGIQRIYSVRVKPSTAEKNVTVNGTYDATDDGVDGYSAVTVNVPKPSFNGHISFGSTDTYSAIIPETQNGFDASKDFEVTIGFWIGAEYTLPSDDSFTLIGTGGQNVYRRYPQIELDHGGVWFAVPRAADTWGDSYTVSSSTWANIYAKGSFNWLKLKYVAADMNLSLWYSINGTDFTKIHDITVSDAPYNDTSYPMAIGNTAFQSTARAPYNSNFYIDYSKCKIVSDGNVVYGLE